MVGIYGMDTKALMQLIATRVKTRREQHDLTQQQLAARAHVGQMSVSNIEHAGGLGRKSVTIETATKIALALGIDLWQLCLPSDDFLAEKEITDLIKKYSVESPTRERLK